MSGEYEQGADGTLVAEFRLAEDIHRANIENNNYRALTCATTNERAFYQCADVAGAATIASSNSTRWAIEASDLYYGELSGYFDASDASPFGVECSGDHYGDGTVNAFDIAVFISAMFARPPYDVALTTLTVDIRSDHNSECSGDNSRADWQVALDSSYCPSERRRLGDGVRHTYATNELVTTRSRHLSSSYFDGATNGLKLDLWDELEHGAWYRVAIEGLQQVTELFLGNAWAEPAIGLVNQPYPKQGNSDSPSDPHKLELRWARRVELVQGDDAQCQSIVNGVSGSVALYGDTLSIRQEGSSSQLLCAFDLYVYKPYAMISSRASIAHANNTGLQILRGSSWRNLKSTGTLLSDVVLHAADASPPPPPLAPPLAPVVDPTLPQKTATTGTNGTLIVVGIIAVIVLIFGILACQVSDVRGYDGGGDVDRDGSKVLLKTGAGYSGLLTQAA